MYFLYYLMCALISAVSYASLQVRVAHDHGQLYALTLSFAVDPSEGVYAEHIHLAVDNPAVTLSALESHQESVFQYKAACKEKVSCFMGPCTLHARLTAQSSTCLAASHLYVTYQLISSKHSTTRVFCVGDVLDTQALQAGTVPTEVDTAYTQTLAAIPISVDQSGIVCSMQQCRAGQDWGAPWLGVAGAVVGGLVLVYRVWIFSWLELLVLVGCLCIVAYAGAFWAQATMLGLASFVSLFVGIVLLYRAQYVKRCKLCWIAGSMAMALIACCVVLGARAYQKAYQSQAAGRHHISWP